MQVHGAKERGAAAGQRVAVNLGGVELEEVRRGDSLVTPGTLEPTRVLDVRLELLPSSRPLKHGARVRFHQGTGEVLGRVALAAVLPGPGRPAPSAAPGQGAEVPAGADAYARLRLESPAVLSRGDRFILRAYSPPVTIAGGLVLDPLPDRGPIRAEASRRRFEALDPAGAATPQEGDDRALAALVAERGAAGLPLASVVARLGVAPADLPAIAERHARARTAVARGRHPRRARRARPAGAGRARPGGGLPPRAAADRGDAARGGARAAVRAGGRRRVRARDRRPRGGGHGRGTGPAGARLAPGVAVARGGRARRAIERAFRDSGLKPPEPEAIAAEHAIGAAILDRIVKLLVRQRVLVRLDSLLFHEQALDRLRREIGALKEAAGPQARIDVATFKERYGVTRKYAIPLLEYLDRERVTRRVGETRILI